MAPPNTDAAAREVFPPTREPPAQIQSRKIASVPFKTILMCGFASFGGILFGYDSGYINGVLDIPQFKIDYGHSGWVNNTKAYNGYLYNTWQKSLIVSILSAGTLFGSLISGYFADKFGRRDSIIIGCAIYAAGVVVQVQAIQLILSLSVAQWLDLALDSFCHGHYVVSRNALASPL